MEGGGEDFWPAAYQGATAGTVLASKGTRLPQLVHVHPGETVRAAIAVLDEYGVSQLPVVEAEPPLALAEVAGSETGCSSSGPSTTRARSRSRWDPWWSHSS